MRKYNTYKPSNVEWLGDVPSHWKVTRLINRTVQIVGGDWGDDPELESDEHVLLPVIRVQDIENEYEIGDEKLTYRKIKASKIDHRLIDNKTLLIEKSGGGEKQLVGRVAIPKKITMPAICSNFMEKIEMDEQAVPSFFNYIFHALYNRNMNFPFVQQTTGIQNLKSTYYFYTKVAYPNPTEQTAIAAYLDQATANIDKVIATKQKQLEKLEQYKQSKIHECVTKGLNPDVTLKPSGIDWIGNVPSHWKVERLKYVVSKIGSGVTPKGGATVYQTTGIPLIRSQNVHFDGLDFSDIACITEEIHDDMSGSKVKRGDVLLNITGASLGRCYYYDLDDEANVNQHVCILRPNDLMTTNFLYYLMMSEVGQSQIFSGFKGSGREGLGNEAIKVFKIPLPKTKEQKEISYYLDLFCDNIKKEKSIIEQQIEKLKQYRKCLIHECVTGKRKVVND